MDKTKIRTQFPHTAIGQIYLNHAAISPLSDRVKTAIELFLANRNSDNIDNFEEWINLTEETRGLISKLIHADNTERISFLGNTSDALSAVVEGFPWEEGDEIILNTMEFPSNIQPFRILKKRGVKIVYIKPDSEGRITPSMIEQSIGKNTKLVSISAVQYLNGFRADLKSIGKLCREHNLFFVVDAIQALGATPLDVRECKIDALASGCHKWLMSPMGIGFLYLSERLARILKPAKTGWLSVQNPWELSNYDQDWLPVSQHLETGTFNMLGLTGLHASLSHLLDIGIEEIHQEILKLVDYLYTNLYNRQDVQMITPHSNGSHAGIFTFSLSGKSDAEMVVNQLKSKRITISAREGYIRISPHFYNTEEELDLFLNSIFK